MTTSERTGRISLAEPTIDDAERAALTEVLDSGQLAQGEQVSGFEREFGDYCATEYAVATANGTAALHAALEALDIGSGDTVLTTPFTFVATANAIRFTGAEPVFADIDPATYNLDPAAVEATIRERNGDVDALLVVHLYGLPAEMDKLCDIADDYGIPIVEDAAQAHGATYRGQPVGSIGDVGCFSFYPTKNMTTGEGGMIVTDREDVTRRARRFIDHGRRDGYNHSDIGHNFRMTDMAAAIGRVQLERLPDMLEARRENASQLAASLTETTIQSPTIPDHVEHAFNQFTVRSDRRNDLQEMLDNFGIDSSIYYPRPVHKQGPYRETAPSLPVAELAAHEVLSLPVHPGISSDEIEAIGTAIEYFESYG